MSERERENEGGLLFKRLALIEGEKGWFFFFCFCFWGIKKLILFWWIWKIRERVGEMQKREREVQWFCTLVYVRVREKGKVGR